LRFLEASVAPIVVLVAQAFKESLATREVADALAEGARRAGAMPRVVPGSDGGDGLLDALAPPRRTAHEVTGPLGMPVRAELGWLDPATAVVETRLACGLSLVAPDARDPLRASTRGAGELVVIALGAGAETVLVGLGGSATMDGGLGAARAWGWEARDAGGTPLPDGGGALEALARLDPAPALRGRLIALADVQNPLLGSEGAAVYAPQKGAAPEVVVRLVNGLGRLVAVAAPWDGPNLARRSGAGAAGGLGFGLLCFGAAVLVPGAAWVLDRNDLAGALAGAALVVVAEARFDATSLTGKLTGEVIARARARRVPVTVVTPDARVAPDGVAVTTATGRWSAADLARHTARAVRDAFALPRL
jgi:glycerate kinase